MFNEYLNAGLVLFEVAIAETGDFNNEAPAVTPKAFKACLLFDEKLAIVSGH
jgi:hypothetical protein